MKEEILRIENLHKSFGKLKVLKGLNLVVHEGEVVVIIGPSGGGKSTLLRCINHLESYQKGKIYFRGELVTEKTNLNEMRAKIGMVFQQFNLFPHLRVIDNLTLAPVKVKGLSREEAEKKAKKLLERVGLSDKIFEYPHKLSGGQQQRVAIARAL
ncbi:MAG: polar amino acid ABC transporter ATP-binding protein, partial [Thermotoga sp. 4484_232]